MKAFTSNPGRARLQAFRVALAFLGSLLAATPAISSDPSPRAAQTVVVFNADSPDSQALAAYYAEKRGIPAAQVLSLSTPLTDDISRQDYERRIAAPLREAFLAKGWWLQGKARSFSEGLSSRISQSSIRTLAIMRGIPFRILRGRDDKQPGREDESSVDSEIALLCADPYDLRGPIPNPFFKQTSDLSKVTTAPGLLLVSRLDGPDEATVRRMIDDALIAETNGLSGRAVIDLALKDGAYEMGEEWLRRCSALYRQKGIPGYLERSSDAISSGWPLPDTALYFGWYHDHVTGVLADPDFRFAPGAVAVHIHSFSAARLRSSTEHWAGPLLARGAAATCGNVWEPYLPLTCHLDQFNARLLSGASLVEAHASALPVLSWMSILIGDPLYRPFAHPPGSRLGLDGPARDYALFHGVLTQASNKPSPDSDTAAAALKTRLLRLAEKRGSARLIELLGLYCWQSGDDAEAAALLDHAAALYPKDSTDALRARLYQADALRTLNEHQAAREVLAKLPQSPAVSWLSGKLR